MGQIAARAWVHRRHEHHAGGIVDGVACARHAYASVFEWLAQHFEDSPGKFRKFVHEEYAVVSKGYFAGHRVGAASDERHGRDGVVGRAEGAARDQSRA